MPTLDDLKKRIKSVKSTQKITKAMKMVAAAKLRKAQESAEKGRPYSQKMQNIILNLTNSINDLQNAPKLLVGNGNDECVSGTLHIFNPSNTTFVKHFTSTCQYTHDGDGNEQYSFQTFVSGYINQTSPLTRFQFKMEAGDIDAGDICLYGIN